MDTAIYWRESGWLWLALLPPLFGVFNRWWRHRRWRAIVDPALLPWAKSSTQTNTQRLRLIALLIGWGLLCVALAGPRSIRWIPPQLQPDIARVMIIVDLSASMNAQDLYPDRRGVAQQMIRHWLSQKTAAQPLSVGLILFAGHAFELSAPTHDRPALMHFIDSLGAIDLPTLGNNLSAAIKLAQSRLDKNGGGANRLLILSDGDMEPTQRQAAAALLDKLATEPNLRIALVGVGTQQAVTLNNRHGELITQQSRPVLSRLQARWMKRLAARHDDIDYRHYRDAEHLSLQHLLALPALPVDDALRPHIVWREWFAPFLLGGLLFITLSLSRRRASALTTILLAVTLLGAHPAPLQAAQTDTVATPAADGYLKQFEKGVDCYRAKHYPCAIRAFTAAVLQAENNAQKARAIFNLGNSYLLAGDYDQAEVLFRDASLHGLDQKMADANRAVAQALQDELQRQLQQIRETLRLARWRAAANGEMPPTLADVVAFDRKMKMPPGLNKKNTRYYQAWQNSLQQQLKKLLASDKGLRNGQARNWVKTRSRQAQSTAALMNRLFEMQIDILAPLKQALPIKGMRPW